MIKLYNALTRKKEIFRPLLKGRVGLYTCGPTVYNFAHIGNLRTYIFEDVLRRTLEYAGYDVRHVMNITDVEDKIFRDAKKEGKTIFEFVKPYEKAFFEDLKKLNIEKAWKYPKATEHISEMVRLIHKLVQKGMAYEMNGSIYFSISKFGPYGKLSRVKARELKAGARVDTDEYTKENLQDFALWKIKKAGEPSWKTIWGDGHPGWHIECSVMSMKYLGSTIDIHTGGVDNIFPHHENEIAQSEASTGKKFVRYWIHGEHLLVKGEKMAKSLGNFFTLRDIEAKGFSPLAFRYLVLAAHYRSKLNFTWEALVAAENSLERIYDFVQRLKEGFSTGSKHKKNIVRVPSRTYLNLEKKFVAAIFDDLNTPKALAAVWDMAHAYNKNPDRFNAKAILRLLYEFDEVFGFGFKNIKTAAIPQKVLTLAKKREVHRKNRQWQEADKIRAQINSLGYVLEDTPQGQKIKKQ